MPTHRLRSIVFDCARPAALAHFWAAVLGYTVRPHVEDAPSVVILPQDDGPTLWFERVPESKIVKNRVHLDINLESLEQLDHLVELGARILRPLGAAPNDKWAILADPEGNEFCAFPPQPS
jgi:hypothetical protein